MATAGPNAPGTITSDAGTGDTVWENPSNAASSNDVYAQTASAFNYRYSYYLRCTNFGLSIPTDATVNGVTVSIERRAVNAPTGDNWVNDETVKLVKEGTVSGTNKAITGDWTASDTTQTYGGTADLWGLTLTPANINSSIFGVVLSTAIYDYFGGAGERAKVDFVSITITYTPAGASGVKIPVAMNSYRQRRV